MSFHFYFSIIIIFLIFTPSLIHAEEFNYEFNGNISEQLTYRFLRDNYLLNPDRSIVGISSWRNRLYGDIHLKFDYHDIRFISKFRPAVSSDEKSTSIKNIIDDAYLDFKFKDGFFLYLGKKNVRDGVGLGSNPTDFLGEGKEVDMTKREEERRVEREGNYLMGIDTFYKNITLTAILAPRINDLQEERSRLLLKANVLIESINTDISFHYFNKFSPRIGLNISTTVSDKLILYTETAFRWGSNKKIVRLVKPGIPNVYEINDLADNQRVYPHLVVGGHYTFKDKTNIIYEYIYNSDGYDSKEWNELSGFIKYSHDEYKKGFLRDLMRSNLLRANNLMSFGQLRKNYIFTRISNPEIFGKMDGALVLFLNVDDKSFVINPSLDYKITTNTNIDLTAIIFSGDSSTEFGMTPWKSEVSLVYKYFF